MKLNVIGLGYIGLPTALMFSAKGGIEVVGTDYNSDLIRTLKSGKLTFEESGLHELFIEAVNKGIKFTDEYISTDIYIIAVPTPYDKFTKKVDASYVIEAVKSIMNVCKNECIIIIESTVSPGTIERKIKPLIMDYEKSLKKFVHLVHAPERILPGNMIYELAENSRTIGVDDIEIGKKITNLYSKITSGKIICTDIKTAEMTKVVENTFRAVNIAFANELVKICNQEEMDVYEIIKICNMHPRVNILNPGPGVGGHCIPVDPWFLVGDYPSLTNVVWESLKVNDSMPEYVLKKTYEIMIKEGLSNFEKVGLYGLTYKENVNDYRESPTLQIIEKQKEHLAIPLKVYDPLIKKDIVDNQYHDFDKFLNDIDLIIIMVKHDEIKQNFSKIKEKVVFDTQNVFPMEKTYKL